MSIGKSSIARAVASTSTTAKAQSEIKDNPVITKFDTDKIGALKNTDDDLTALKNSVQKRGILCPVIIAVTAKNDAWLLDGHRRLAVAKALGFSQINAIVIKAENKNEVNRLYKELNQTKSASCADDIHEEKFRVLAVKDHDLPAYLL